MIYDFHDHFVKHCQAQRLDAKQLIGDALKTPEGGRLLQALNEAIPILDHTFHPEPRFQSHHAGRLEMLALLWRYGTGTEYTPPPTTNPANQ